MIQYDWKYYEHMLEMYSPTAQKIVGMRWSFVYDILKEIKNVLDYGCGCNFFSMFAPPNIQIDSFDIGHINGRQYPQTGIRRKRYDLITFWDVLEHVDWIQFPDANILSMMQKTKYIAATVPVLPEGQSLKEWKHYKPGEHLTYFTKETLNLFFSTNGFSLVREGYPECPLRLDILSVLYKRKES